MVRICKQDERRSRCPKRCRPPALKTGPKAEKASFKPHANGVEGDRAQMAFIPKIK